MHDTIAKLRNKEDLNEQEMSQALEAVMSGSVSEHDMAEFLLALNAKGPTIEEITGAARVMRKFSLSVKTGLDVILDTCGTGGDQKNTFNISTLVALVVSGAGVAVAKHGNRSVSSRCGSADLLEALGVNVHLDQDRLARCLDELGIAFLFAQKFHPAMKNVAQVRKSLGVKTIFNILGPLTNPAGATHQLMGVFSQELVEPLAHVLRKLGSRQALVVRGSDGLDEITTTNTTLASHWNGKAVVSYEIDPKSLGIALAQPQDLTGGDIETNVRLTYEILNGGSGPKKDIVLLNAAYALYVAGKAHSPADGLSLAQESLDSGKALAKLEALKKITNQ